MSPAASSSVKRRRVAVLGATGAVGQAFIRLLANHPWFELTEVAASERSAGKPYVDAARWIGGDPMPAKVRDSLPAFMPKNSVRLGQSAFA